MTLLNWPATAHRVPFHRSARPDPCRSDPNAHTLSATGAPAARTCSPALPGKGTWLHTPPCNRHAAGLPVVCANAQALRVLVTASDRN